jgi:hypothetical protein
MISRELVMYKLKAFAISLTIFVSFAIALGVWVKYVLYPDYLFELDGGLQGLKLIWSVDFVLGPLLVLVVFHPRKTRQVLLMDVLLVGLIQLSAMAWGGYTVWNQRPVAMVYSGMQFLSLPRDVLSLQGAAMDDLPGSADVVPSYFFSRHPKTPEEETKATRLAFSSGVPFSQQVSLLVPVTSVKSEAFALNNRVERYVESSMKDEWRTWASGRASATPADYRFVLFMGRYGNAVLVFNPDLSLAGYLPLSGDLLPTLPVAAPRAWDAR